jgi:hypothetical protein
MGIYFHCPASFIWHLFYLDEGKAKSLRRNPVKGNAEVISWLLTSRSFADVLITIRNLQGE